MSLGSKGTGVQAQLLASVLSVGGAGSMPVCDLGVGRILLMELFCQFFKISVGSLCVKEILIVVCTI